MRLHSLLITILTLSAGLFTAGARAAERAAEDCWTGYLDYAYVYSSAEPRALRERLDRYGAQCGVALSDYIAEKIEKEAVGNPHLGAQAQRRRAVAHLLQYLSSDDPRELAVANEAIGHVSGRLDRRENRYWYHYIRAHRALEDHRAGDFGAEIFHLWLDVVSELEAPYAALESLALNDPASSGFISALPYVYENVARLIVLQTQQKGLVRGLDPLAAIVRMLADGRIGGQPDVVALASSSQAYLERIVTRLNGPESSGGRLSFTLGLFEANKLHARASDLLAREGFSPAAVQALRSTGGAYSEALTLADTLQGQCAVYTRALRTIGEVYATSERTGAAPDFEMPFSIEGAMKLFGELEENAGRGWQRQGYRDHGREAFLVATRGLWEEIQESSLNAASWYRSLALADPRQAASHRRQAARLYTRYLTFFRRHNASADSGTLPPSAYFAAYRAARGLGDTLYYDPDASYDRGELRVAAKRYLEAIQLYPFDRPVRERLAEVLQRQGRETEFLALTKPVAQSVARSPSVDAWIRNGEAASEEIDVLRRALSDDRVLAYLGFSRPSRLSELEEKLTALRERRETIAAERSRIEMQREQLEEQRRKSLADSTGEESDAGLPAVSAPAPQSGDSIAISKLEDALRTLDATDGRLAIQVEARERALPLYRRALATDSLPRRLAAERDHPVHLLLQRLHRELAQNEF